MHHQPAYRSPPKADNAALRHFLLDSRSRQSCAYHLTVSIRPSALPTPGIAPSLESLSPSSHLASTGPPAPVPEPHVPSTSAAVGSGSAPSAAGGSRSDRKSTRLNSSHLGI